MSSAKKTWLDIEADEATFRRGISNDIQYKHLAKTN